MADITNTVAVNGHTDSSVYSTTSSSPISPALESDPLRPVILETTKESYLLSPNIVSSSPGSGTTGVAERVYDIALILETEVVVEDEQPMVEAEAEPVLQAQETANKPADPIIDESKQVETAPLPKTDDVPPEPQPSETEKDIMMDEPTPITKTPIAEPGSSPLPPSRASPVHSPEPRRRHEGDDGEVPLSSSPPPEQDHTDKASMSVLLEDEIPKPPLSIQVLQRNLTRSMFRFEKDSVFVRDPSGDGMEAEWAIQIKNWKWAPKGARERLIDVDAA